MTTASVVPLRRTSPLPLLRRSAYDVAVEHGHDGHVVVLGGEIDRAAETHVRSVHRLLAVDPRPVVIDCTRVTFIDAGGLGVLLDALDRRPFDRLANVPPAMARLLRLVGRADVLHLRTRHAVAVASYEGVDVVSAARAAEVFRLANLEGCAYDVVTVPFDATTCVAPWPARRWRAVVVPPLEGWLGLSPSMPITRWARSLTGSSVQVLGIGSGRFLLAAAGRLDRCRVAGGACGPMLAASAPHAVVTAAATVDDGAVSTAADGDGGVALGLAMVGHDYGGEVRERVGARLRRLTGRRALT